MKNFTLQLPDFYSTAEVGSFHGRDREGLAETVAVDQIRKGIVLDGIPVVISISLKASTADCHVSSDGGSPDESVMIRIARNLLGLNIDPEVFAKFARRDSVMGSLVRKNPHLRIPQAATVFEALTWAIIGQQINLPFAIKLRRSFIRVAGRRHSDGLWCYPDAASASRIEPEELLPYQFSRSKAETLVRVARLIDSGVLSLDELQNKPQAEIETALLSIKGIGPWTVNYTLMRGFALGDCSLHGDAGIRNAIHRLTNSKMKPTSAEIQSFLENYRPHRTMAAAHLWASL
ncbi:MAG: DNA-3-methyladenine glycosylase 2 [Luteolibacter sp.]|uniref:DNA-3-methyladenine glycosylase family protein n=1 Tax=Luteolibacter sp. TaxID=1962973 RepID=UPI003263196B